MNPKFRLLLYVVLAGCLAAFGAALYTTYHSPELPTPPPALATNAIAVTNLPASTNVAGLTNATSSTNQPMAQVAEPADDAPLRKSSPRLGRMMAYGIVMFFSLVGLAVLIGHDVSRY